VARDSEDPDYRERIRSSFAKQGLMSTLKATLGNVSPGSLRSRSAPTHQSPNSMGSFTPVL
jgi:hypothetical protein